MPWKPPVHQPIGLRSKAERDRDYAQRRDRPSLALYRSAAWRKARVVFLRDHPLCSACQCEGVIRPATVVDHRDPHRGDRATFWDESRWQPLCAPCHAKKTAANDGGFGNPRR